MKTDQVEGHSLARKQVAKSVAGTSDPHADFSDVQWYCYQARQTVYFTAFSSETLTETRLIEIARDLMVFAPQLTTGYVGSRAGEIPGDDVLAQLVSLVKVKKLDAYPEAWPVIAEPFVERPDLPLFRIRACVLKNGADDQGRVACIQVLSTHALMEGVDSALLSRSQVSAHEDNDVLLPKPPMGGTIRMALLAHLVVPAQLALAAIIAPRKVDFRRRMLVLERARLRRVALALGVRQRSLMFALVAHALNNGGAGFSRRKLSCTYTDLDGASAPRTGEGFFRFRLMEAKFKVRDDAAAFVRGVDAEIGRIEARDVSATQRYISALFKVHRRLKRVAPFLYSDRIFRFTGFYHMDLSLVPPHRLSGPLARGLMEPIYCGTYHEGMNVCVFAPGRREVTLSFNMDAKHAPHVDDILPLLDRLEAQLAVKPE